MINTQLIDFSSLTLSHLGEGIVLYLFHMSKIFIQAKTTALQQVAIRNQFFVRQHNFNVQFSRTTGKQGISN